MSNSNSGHPNLFCDHGLTATYDVIPPPTADGNSRRFYHCPRPVSSRCDFFSVEDMPASAPVIQQPAQPPPLKQPQQKQYQQFPHQQQQDANEPENTPLCKCGQNSVSRVVRKQGPNQNRTFYVCPKQRDEQCKFFEWADANSNSTSINPSSNSNFNSNNNNMQHQKQTDQQKKPIVSATGFVWPGTGSGSNSTSNNSNNNNAGNDETKPFNNQDMNKSKHTSANPMNTKLSIRLQDTTTVTFPVRATAPQGLKDAVSKFSHVSIDKSKKGVFGETIGKIPIEKVFEFDTFVKAHAPSIEIEYEVPRNALAQLSQYHKSEREREKSGDVITRSLEEILPPKLTSSLMQFQWHGIHFALKRGGRCLIGDDMGLGKTIQAIAIARVYMQDWPLLIVCPSSLRLNWKEELLKWLGEDIQEHHIQVFMTGKDITVANRKSSRMKKVNILSYDLIRKLAPDKLNQCQFIIADESHYLKSITAQRTKAVVPMVKNSRRALLLSGTPALSRPVELFTQVNALAPSLFPSYNEYVVRYCNARQTYFGFDVSGSSHLDELHMIMTGTILIRRKKEDVLTQLPEKIRQVMWVETKPSIMKYISKRTAEFEDAKAAASAAESPEEANALSMRVKGIQNDLYALSADAKIQAVLEFCKDTAESGCKFIVFAHHAKVIDALDEFVKTKLKLGFIRIDGNTAQGERQALCKRFQEDNSKCRVALLSITAAGVGLTLTQASAVIFAELYWNPGTLLQAEDRAHRIGQRNSILVNYLLAKKTLDESMWKSVRRKLTVVGQSLTGAAAKMDAEEGKKGDALNVIASNSSSKSTGDKVNINETDENETSKPKRKEKDIRSFFNDDNSKKRKRERAKHESDDADDDIANDTVEIAQVPSVPDDDDVEIVRTNGSRLNHGSKKQKLGDSNKSSTIDLDNVFPMNQTLDTDEDADFGGNKDELIDPDLALARKLQSEYDPEL